MCLVSYEHWAGCDFYEVLLLQMGDAHTELQYSTVSAAMQGVWEKRLRQFSLMRWEENATVEAAAGLFEGWLQIPTVDKRIQKTIPGKGEIKENQFIF